MQIDTLWSATDSPRHSFVRFDLDPTVAQSPIGSITLRLVAAMTVGSESDDSGEVWQVLPFDRPALFTGDPGNVSTVAIAGTLGAVTFAQVLDWALPTDIIDNGSVYLGVRPLSSNTAHYVNLNGMAADVPTLVVTCL